MKVTTELKSLIKRSFEEKRKAVEMQFREMAEKEYQEKIEWMESLPEYQQFLQAQRVLKEKLKEEESLQHGVRMMSSEKCCPYYVAMDFNRVLEMTSKDFLRDNVYNYLRYNEETREAYNKELTKINVEQESLLIKLTYERDLEKIKEMLGEYGISLT